MTRNLSTTVATSLLALASLASCGNKRSFMHPGSLSGAAGSVDRDQARSLVDESFWEGLEMSFNDPSIAMGGPVGGKSAKAGYGVNRFLAGPGRGWLPVEGEPEMPACFKIDPIEAPDADSDRVPLLQSMTADCDGLSFGTATLSIHGRAGIQDRNDQLAHVGGFRYIVDGLESTLKSRDGETMTMGIAGVWEQSPVEVQAVTFKADFSAQAIYDVNGAKGSRSMAGTFEHLVLPADFARPLAGGALELRGFFRVAQAGAFDATFSVMSEGLRYPDAETGCYGKFEAGLIRFHDGAGSTLELEFANCQLVRRIFNDEEI